MLLFFPQFLNQTKIDVFNTKLMKLLTFWHCLYPVLHSKHCSFATLRRLQFSSASYRLFYCKVKRAYI